MKLSPAQRRALDFLSKKDWSAPWWGGGPHTGWPKEMPMRTFDKLLEMKLVTIADGKRFDRVVSITDKGRSALTIGKGNL